MKDVALAFTIFHSIAVIVMLAFCVTAVIRVMRQGRPG